MEKQSLLFQAEEEEEEQNESILPTEAPVELAKEMKVESDPAASESATGATVGDEGIIEGAIIGENYENDMDIKNESDDDDEGVIIHAGKMSIQKRTPMKMRPSTRPGTVTKTPADPGREPAVIVNNEELKKLRFSRHVTAFDVDINLLEDHPWRNKNVDLLDYFNYGFNERTWMVYCEKQLRLRAEKGLGPRHAVPHAEKNVEKSQAVANVPSTPAPAQPENQQQTPQTAQPQTHSNYPPQPDPYGPPPPAAPNAYPPRPPPPRPNLPNDQSFPPQMYPPQQGFMPPNMPPGMPPQPKLPPNMPPHMYPPGMMPFPPNMPPWMAPQMPPGSGEGGDNKQRNGEGGNNSNNNNNEADRSRKRERSRGRDDNRRDAAQQPKDGSRREEKGKAEDKPPREERRRSKDRRRSRSTGRTGRSRSNSPKRKRRENSRDRDRDRDRGGKKH